MKKTLKIPKKLAKKLDGKTIRITPKKKKAYIIKKKRKLLTKK